MADMWSRRHTILFAFMGLMALVFLFGCRAFQPEVVIVNKFPETFIMIAPAETSGGYYHFHTWWYGTDEDGYVDRFVWALTDTSLQDPNTVDDEEDENFNPALDISTLEIGHWTTRNDTTFDFALNQGPAVLHHMTLHFVAVDDRGDFDRTPARLHFYSNALGNPEIDFSVRRGDADTAQFYPFADADTIAFGLPFAIRWTGSTPNAYYDDMDMLALRDTVGEHVGNYPAVEPDGLQGFKFQFGGGVDGCNSAEEDCWRPRYYSDASGDSVSYFGKVTELTFANEISGDGVDIYSRRIDFNTLEVRVNAIDVAGVEIAADNQLLNVVVNYDPEVRLLAGETDPYFPSDTDVYPYYRIEGSNEHFAFMPGDTVPDRAYVVVKAVGRDDQRDLKLDLFDWDVQFQGVLDHRGLYQEIGWLSFSTDASALGCNWVATEAGGWSSDTLGFYVGPFENTINMRAVDEHLRRGTDDALAFTANYGPCVQCIEMLNKEELSSFDVSADCWDVGCIAEPETLWAAAPGAVPGPEYHLASRVAEDRSFFVNEVTGEVHRSRPFDMTNISGTVITATRFEFRFLLHGKDGHPHEYPVAGKETERIMGWNYEVNYDSDPDNLIQDGSGVDDLRFMTDMFSTVPDSSIYIDNDGTWYLTVEWMVPSLLITAGPSAYMLYLGALFPSVDSDHLFAESTKQLGGGSIMVKARDQASCDARSDRGKYYYFRQVRTPTDEHGYKCFGTYEDQKDTKILADFARVSEVYEKQFVLRVITVGGSHFPLD